LPATPSGLAFGPMDAADDAIDSDVNADGITDVFTLVSGEVNLDIDAGVIDVEAPTFTVPADIAVVCGEEIPVADIVDIADNCSTGLVAEFEDVEDFDECGGTITRTWTVTDDCGNVAEQVQIITIEPAPVPTIEIPELEETLTCAEASEFVAPMASFSNGIDAPCLIEGEVPGEVTGNFTQCGGEIVVTWTVVTEDNCNREAVVATATIIVEPAPDPIFEDPALPETLTCAEADAFVAPLLSFSNNATADECLITGEVLGTVTEDFDECGGTITITWIAPTGCDNNSVTLEEVITIEAAPMPTIEIPAIEETISCGEAAEFVVPNATFSNGEVDDCLITGEVPGVAVEDFDECGGTITRCDRRELHTVWWNDYNYLDS